MRAKCFDITRRAVDAIAQHQPALLRCDALSTALLHHYFYRCGVLRRRKVARAHATATQTSCTHGYVETGRRWCPSRWSRRLVAVPTRAASEVASSVGSVLVASAQFVGARRLDVAAPRFEARPSRRRRRKDEELLGAFGSATLPRSLGADAGAVVPDGAYVIIDFTQDRRAYKSKMPEAL